MSPSVHHSVLVLFLLLPLLCSALYEQSSILFHDRTTGSSTYLTNMISSDHASSIGNDWYSINLPDGSSPVDLWASETSFRILVLGESGTLFAVGENSDSALGTGTFDNLTVVDWFDPEAGDRIDKLWFGVDKVWFTGRIGGEDSLFVLGTCDHYTCSTGTESYILTSPAPVSFSSVVHRIDRPLKKVVSVPHATVFLPELPRDFSTASAVEDVAWILGYNDATAMPFPSAWVDADTAVAPMSMEVMPVKWNSNGAECMGPCPLLWLSEATFITDWVYMDVAANDSAIASAYVVTLLLRSGDVTSSGGWVAPAAVNNAFESITAATASGTFSMHSTTGTLAGDLVCTSLPVSMSTGAACAAAFDHDLGDRAATRPSIWGHDPAFLAASLADPTLLSSGTTAFPGVDWDWPTSLAAVPSSWTGVHPRMHASAGSIAMVGLHPSAGESVLRVVDFDLTVTDSAIPNAPAGFCGFDRNYFSSDYFVGLSWGIDWASSTTEFRPGTTAVTFPGAARLVPGGTFRFAARLFDYSGEPIAVPAPSYFSDETTDASLFDPYPQRVVVELAAMSIISLPYLFGPAPLVFDRRPTFAAAAADGSVELFIPVPLHATATTFSPADTLLYLRTPNVSIAANYFYTDDPNDPVNAGQEILLDDATYPFAPSMNDLTLQYLGGELPSIPAFINGIDSAIHGPISLYGLAFDYSLDINDVPSDDILVLAQCGPTGSTGTGFTVPLTFDATRSVYVLPLSYQLYASMADGAVACRISRVGPFADDAETATGNYSTLVAASDATIPIAPFSPFRSVLTFADTSPSPSLSAPFVYWGSPGAVNATLSFSLANIFSVVGYDATVGAALDGTAVLEAALTPGGEACDSTVMALTDSEPDMWLSGTVARCAREDTAGIGLVSIQYLRVTLDGIPVYIIPARFGIEPYATLACAVADPADGECRLGDMGVATVCTKPAGDVDASCLMRRDATPFSDPPVDGVFAGFSYVERVIPVAYPLPESIPLFASAVVQFDTYYGGLAGISELFDGAEYIGAPQFSVAISHPSGATVSYDPVADELMASVMASPLGQPIVVSPQSDTLTVVTFTPRLCPGNLLQFVTISTEFLTPDVNVWADEASAIGFSADVGIELYLPTGEGGASVLQDSITLTLVRAAPINASEGGTVAYAELYPTLAPVFPELPAELANLAAPNIASVPLRAGEQLILASVFKLNELSGWDFLRGLESEVFDPAITITATVELVTSPANMGLSTSTNWYGFAYGADFDLSNPAAVFDVSAPLSTWLAGLAESARFFVVPDLFADSDGQATLTLSFAVAGANMGSITVSIPLLLHSDGADYSTPLVTAVDTDFLSGCVDSYPIRCPDGALTCNVADLGLDSTPFTDNLGSGATYRQEYLADSDKWIGRFILGTNPVTWAPGDAELATSLPADTEYAVSGSPARVVSHSASLTGLVSSAATYVTLPPVSDAVTPKLAYEPYSTVVLPGAELLLDARPSYDTATFNTREFTGGRDFTVTWTVDLLPAPFPANSVDPVAIPMALSNGDLATLTLTATNAFGYFSVLTSPDIAQVQVLAPVPEIAFAVTDTTTPGPAAEVTFTVDAILSSEIQATLTSLGLSANLVYVWSYSTTYSMGAELQADLDAIVGASAAGALLTIPSFTLPPGASFEFSVMAAYADLADPSLFMSSPAVASVAVGSPAPVACAGPAFQTVQAGDMNAITLSATCSTNASSPADAAGLATNLTYSWAVPGALTAVSADTTSSTVSIYGTTPGVFEVVLTVTDTLTAQSSDATVSISVTSSAPPVVSLLLRGAEQVSQHTLPPGTTVWFSATAKDTADESASTIPVTFTATGIDLTDAAQATVTATSVRILAAAAIPGSTIVITASATNAASATASASVTVAVPALPTPGSVTITPPVINTGEAITIIATGFAADASELPLRYVFVKDTSALQDGSSYLTLPGTSVTASNTVTAVLSSGTHRVGARVLTTSNTSSAVAWCAALATVNSPDVDPTDHEAVASAIDTLVSQATAGSGAVEGIGYLAVATETLQSFETEDGFDPLASTTSRDAIVASFAALDQSELAASASTAKTAVDVLHTIASSGTGLSATSRATITTSLDSLVDTLASSDSTEGVTAGLDADDALTVLETISGVLSSAGTDVSSTTQTAGELVNKVARNLALKLAAGESSSVTTASAAVTSSVATAATFTAGMSVSPPVPTGIASGVAAAPSVTMTSALSTLLADAAGSDASVSLSMTMLAQPSQSTGSADFVGPLSFAKLDSDGADVTASELDVTSLEDPLTIEIYIDLDLLPDSSALAATNSTVVLKYWDDSTQTWSMAGVETVSFDPVTGLLVGTTTHLSSFSALLHEWGISINTIDWDSLQSVTSNPYPVIAMIFLIAVIAALEYLAISKERATTAIALQRLQRYRKLALIGSDADSAAADKAEDGGASSLAIEELDADADPGANASELSSAQPVNPIAAAAASAGDTILAHLPGGSDAISDATPSPRLRHFRSPTPCPISDSDDVQDAPDCIALSPPPNRSSQKSSALQSAEESVSDAFADMQEPTTAAVAAACAGTKPGASNPAAYTAAAPAIADPVISSVLSMRWTRKTWVVFTKSLKRRHDWLAVWHLGRGRTNLNRPRRMALLSVVVTLAFVLSAAVSVTECPTDDNGDYIYASERMRDAMEQGTCDQFTLIQTLLVGVLCALVTVPVSALIGVLFSHGAPVPFEGAPKTLSPVEIADTLREAAKVELKAKIPEPVLLERKSRLKSFFKAVTETGKKRRNRAPVKTWGRWATYAGYTISGVVALISCVLVMLYGLTMPTPTALSWLLSCGTSVAQDVLISSPLKILSLAAVGTLLEFTDVIADLFDVAQELLDD
jgi:hypothetical protein